MMIGADDTVDAVTLRLIKQGQEVHMAQSAHPVVHDAFFQHEDSSPGMSIHSVMYSLAIVAAIFAGPHMVDYLKHYEKAPIVIRSEAQLMIASAVPIP